MSGTETELQTRIREHAYYLWEDAGCPEGRAEEFWARAVELETSAKNGRAIQQAEIRKANAAEDSPPPRGAKAAVKRRRSSSAEQRTTKMPTVKPAPLDTSSRQRAASAEGAASTNAKGRQPIAAGVVRPPANS
jgi:hypothetical protein